MTVLFIAALTLDSACARFCRASGVEDYLHVHKLVRDGLKAPGEYGVTLLVAIVATLLHRQKWRAGVFVLLATAVSGVNGLIKWIVGRTRPFKLHDDLAEPFIFSPFRGGMRGLLDSKNLCFPSGHAALAFATAASLAVLWPRYRWGFFAVATMVAIERFTENAHWLSDTVAAAALGIAGVQLIRWIWWRKIGSML